MADDDIQLEPPTVRHRDVVPAVEDRSYLAYIGSALFVALAGGFLLAIVLPLAETGTIPWEDRVPLLIQAHGWAQLQGWAGLFVAGMAMRLMPRFAGRKPLKRSVTVPVLVLLVASVVVRTVAEPFIDGAAGDWLVLVAAVSGALGTVATGGALFYTLVRGRRKQEPWRYFALAGAAWWVAWAAFILAAGIRAYSNGRFTPFALDDALTWMVLIGPVGNFIWAVQSRSVPVFFGRKTPKLRHVVVPGVALNLGGVLIAASLLPVSDSASARLVGLGLLASGIGFAWLPPLAGSVWGTAHRLRPRARSAARYVLAANIAAMGAGILLVWAGSESAWRGAYEAVGVRDAARHTLGLGLITLLIIGMAQLVAPLFALERAEARKPGLVERGPFWLLIAATLIRVYGALATGHMNEDARLHLVSSAGVLAWLAIALFAVLVVRARRREPRMKAILFDGAAAAMAQKAADAKQPDSTG
ncbi:MAG TPA: hypothetical protein VN697_15470 [Tepidiformaceae bacterium]|nr:hypothetical protein [Tepidiformaceae bacterium]